MYENERRISATRRKDERRTAITSVAKERRDAEQKKRRNAVDRRTQGRR